MSENEKGNTMYQWATDLFPICRSITGEGVRQTLTYLKKQIPALVIHEVDSGYKAFDWVVPDEWTIRDAYITDCNGEKIVDFKSNNLHIVSYSEPIDIWISKEDLEQHLHSMVDQPDAIPYVTSYYSRNWGFCITHNQRQSLQSGDYHVVIDSELKKGVMNYGEILIPGTSKQEIFLSTYICHPSMANNELSGPVVATAIAQWITSHANRKYTYRIIFIPETIGSIVYLSKHHEHLKENVVAGFNLSCVGDDRMFSFLPSRTGETLADKVAEHALRYNVDTYKKYTFLERGSDERQYCSPLIDLPVCSIMRSKYGTYPEYHSSLDDLDLISSEGLSGAYEILIKTIEILECNQKYKSAIPCEPQLGKRNLYPNIGAKKHSQEVKDMVDLLAYCDGHNDLIDIGEILNRDALYLNKIAEKLIQQGIIDTV
jgi:aminopeptidase-like protein